MQADTPFLTSEVRSMPLLSSRLPERSRNTAPTGVPKLGVWVLFALCICALFGPSRSVEAQAACHPSVEDWAARCFDNSGYRVSNTMCPSGFVILDVGQSLMESTRIEVASDPTRGFQNVRGFGVSVVGEFQDFTQAPAVVREPFERVITCLERDPQLRIDGSLPDDTGPIERSGQHHAGTSEHHEPGATQEHFVRTDVRFHTMRLAAFLAFVLLLVSRRRDRQLLRPSPPANRRERLALVALVLLAMGLRLPLLLSTPAGPFELETFASYQGLPRPSQIQLMWQTPGLQALLTPWHILGGKLGVGGELWWLRLPNLGLVAWVVVNLVRIGRLLDARQAGWGAAILFAVIPKALIATIFQGHYFLELATALWFVERLTTYVVERRPVYAGLAMSAAAAMWAGHMCFFIVAPGLVAFFVIAWRRGRGTFALTTTLIFELLYVPLLVSAAASAMAYAAISVSEFPAHYEAMEIELRFGHHPMQVEFGAGSVLSFPHEYANRLFGGVAALMAMAGVALLWLRRWRCALFPTIVVLLFGVARTQAAVRWLNFDLLMPFILFVPLWGFCMLRGRTKTALVGGFLAIAFGVTLFNDLEEKDPTIENDNVPWPVTNATVQDFEIVLHSPDNSHAPLLLAGIGEDKLHLLCRDRATAEAIMSCRQLARAAEVRRGYNLLSFDQRRVYDMEYYFETTPFWPEDACAEFADELGQQPFFVLSHHAGPNHFMIPESCDAFFGNADCRVEVSTVGLVLKTCSL